MGSEKPIPNSRKLMKNPYLLLICFMALTATAQNSWTNLYNGPGNSTDTATAMAVDGSGSLFVTGASVGVGSSSDFATIKYSNAGVPLWTNRYNGPGNFDDTARVIAVDEDGNVFVTGLSWGSGTDFDFATIKYSNGGASLWTNRYTGTGSFRDWPTALVVDGNGDLIVTGLSRGGSSSSTEDYTTIKYSNAGAALWTNRYNGPGNNEDRPSAIAVDNGNNVFVTGYSYSGSGNASADYATIKYSSDGMPLWTNRYNGVGNSSDLPMAIVVDSGGNVLLTGSSSGGYPTIKYSNEGVLLWTNRYEGTVAYAIAVGGDGNVLVTGYVFGGTVNSIDYLTMAYSNDGTPLWTNRYNGPGDGEDYARAITVDANNNVFVTGYSAGSGSGSDYATIKYSGDGVPLSTNRFNGIGNSTDQAVAITLDTSGNVFVTGYSTGGSSDYATIKYGAPTPQQPVVLGSPQMSASGFSFDLTGDPGTQFAIQVSTNLVSWEAVREVVVPAGGNTNIQEAIAPEVLGKFYRVLRL